MSKKREKQIDDFVDGLDIEKALEHKIFNNSEWAIRAWPDKSKPQVTLTQKIKQTGYRRLSESDLDRLKSSLKDIFKEL